jgi:Domain of unknown function (DUF4062)
MSAPKIFLSHTSLMVRVPAGRSFVDAARDGVLRAGFAVSDMQFFPADDRPPAVVCEEAVRGCGVYVGVFGQDYGSEVRDLRWGVSEEVGRDQQTLDVCLQEIHRCQRSTPRPNFIALLGSRYGWRRLPPRSGPASFTPCSRS